MTIVLDKGSLTLIDHYRREHGIRTRKAALAKIIATVIPVPSNNQSLTETQEHPLDVKLREARANPSNEKIPARVKRSFEEMRLARANGTLQTVSHAEMMERLQRRKKANSQ